MAETIFKCSRCGYENNSLRGFKQHLERKRECKPKESDIPLSDVKLQYQGIFQNRVESPSAEKKRKKKHRFFGHENLDYISKPNIVQHVSNPLKGIQDIIKDVYFNKDHEENNTIRTIDGDDDNVEVFTEDGWIKAVQKKVFTKMIYRASDIMEYNVAKKHWNAEFSNFIDSMGEMDNDELLVLILEEVGNTVVNAEKELYKIQE